MPDGRRNRDPERRSRARSPEPPAACAPLDRAASRRARASSSVHTLEEDLQLAAAGKADFPGLLVGDAEIEQARLAVRDHLLRLLDDGALDAAARDRAQHASVGIDHEL